MVLLLHEKIDDKANKRWDCQVRKLAKEQAKHANKEQTRLSFGVGCHCTE